MKTAYIKFITFSALMTLSGITIAEDYSNSSNDEFFGMRDQVRTMDEASKDAYRTERQSRMRSMEDSERESRFGGMGASGKRNMEQGSDRGSRKRDGSGGGKGKGRGQGGGQGSGNQYRYGQGGEQGSGNQYRYGQSDEQGSGNQYRYGQSGGQGKGKGQGGGQGRGRH